MHDDYKRASKLLAQERKKVDMLSRKVDKLAEGLIDKRKERDTFIAKAIAVQCECIAKIQFASTSAIETRLKTKHK